MKPNVAFFIQVNKELLENWAQEVIHLSSCFGTLNYINFLFARKSYKIDMPSWVSEEKLFNLSEKKLYLFQLHHFVQQGPSEARSSSDRHLVLHSCPATGLFSSDSMFIFPLAFLNKMRKRQNSAGLDPQIGLAVIRDRPVPYVLDATSKVWCCLFK